MITIYHNPRCSKSREALELVQQFANDRNLPLNVVDYQKTPLDVETLRTLRGQLGEGAGDMIRTNEEEYASLGLADADEAAVLQALAEHPRLLQRPIIVWGAAAMIGRPPERLPEWLASQS